MAGRPNPRAGAQPQRGNVTGRETARLQAEHSDELRERASEMSMLQGPPVDQVIDVEDMLRDSDDDNAPQFQTLVADRETGAPLVEAMPVVTRRRMREAVSTVEGDDLNRKIEIVPNDDYEDVTIGYDPEAGPRSFTFERGRKYRVPMWMAQHLERQEMLV